MKNIKLVLIIAGAAACAAILTSLLFSGDPKVPSAEDQGKRSAKAVSKASKTSGGQKKKTQRRARISEVAPKPAERPNFEIEKADEENLNEIQRQLLEEIRAALRADDYKKVMRLVHRMQASDEWPDGIPDSIKKAALSALGWYGSKCLPEIVNFLGDANPEIVSEAVSQWEDAIAECDSDREISAQVKLAARVVTDTDSVESILVETMNMRHSVAVETFKDILSNGNAAAKAQVLEQIADYTDDTAITTAEQLDTWLENNPDDSGDEEMYGGMTDEGDADD